MTRFTSVTPNLVVKDVARSTAFYRDVLGFTITMNVPDAEPFVFVGLERDGVPVFLNDKTAAVEDHPEMAATPFGGTNTMFFVIIGVDELYAGLGQMQAGGRLPHWTGAIELPVAQVAPVAHRVAHLEHIG